MNTKHLHRSINLARWLISAARSGLALLAVSLLTTALQAQIAILDGSPLTSHTVAANTIDYPSFTVSPGASVLVVCLEDKNQNLPEPATLTWNGQTLTRDVQTAHAATTSRSLAIYHLFNPTPGTSDITGTMTKTVNQVWMTAYTLTGVDTTVAPIVGSANSGAAAPTGGATGVQSLTVNLVVKGGSWAAVNTTCANVGNTLTITSSAGPVTTVTDYLDGGTGIAAGYVANLATSLAGSPVTITYQNTGPAGVQKCNFAVAAFTPLVPQTYPPALGTLSTDAHIFTNQTANLSVQIWGTPPLSYQWYTNGATSALSNTATRAGSISNVLTISRATLADGAGYTLVATNTYGSVTSSVVHLSFTTPNGYEQAAMSNSPVAFYTFGETNDPSVSNVLAYDATGGFNALYSANVLNGFSGILGPQATADNLPGFVDGNLAVEFSGAVNQQVLVPALNLNTNTFTFTAWINPLGAAQAASAGLVFLRSATSSAGLGFGATQIGGQYPLAYTYSNATFTSSLIVPLNTWSLVAVAVSPTNAVIYLVGTNGLSSATLTAAQVPANFSSDINLGYDNNTGTRVFNGVIDEVAIFNSTLSQSAMLNLYAAASHISYFPASITGQPGPQTLYAGPKVAQFTVVAAGSPTITYQWYKNSTPLTNGLSLTGSTIAGATNAALTISNLFAGDAGNYYVKVSNLSGPVFSSTNALTIVAPIGNAYETALLAVGPLAHYELDETADPSTNNTLAYDYVGGYNGIYGTAVQNGYDGIQGPQPSTGFPGFTSTNMAATFAADPNSVITLPPWNLSTDTNIWTGTTLAGWIFPNGTEPNGGGILMTRATGNTCGINYLNFLDANGNRIMGYSWNNDNSATWQWNSGLITPQNQWSLVVLTVTPTNATMYVVNTNGFNAATHVLAHVPMAFNGNSMIGQGNVASAATTFNGTIDDVAVFNKPLTANQVLVLFTNASGMAGFPPSISVPPTNLQTVYTGYNAQLQVVAGGTQPLAYQWMAGVSGSGVFTNLVDAGNISGSVKATLTISNINLSQTADYIVVVTNMYGSVTSGVATLSVSTAAPFVVTDITPLNAFYYTGSTATFSATYDGSRPITYQWVTDGGTGTFTNIPNATNSTLVISNVQAGNVGSYYLMANNASGGPANTSVATLSVSPTSPGAYETAVLTNGAVALYPLNETADPASGSAVAYDYVRGFNGTYGTAVQNGNPNYNIQGPRPASGYPGFPANNFAARFSNVANSAITLPALKLNTNNWTGTTISTWLFPTAAEALATGLVFTRNTAEVSGLCYGNATDANGNPYLGYTWNNNDGATWGWNSGVIAPQNMWSLVTLTVTPTNVTIYVVSTNGIESATFVHNHTPTVFSGTTLIADDSFDGGNGTRAFAGSMDDVALFNQPLTSSQVMALFTAGSGISTFPPPTLGIAPSGTGNNLTLTWSAGSMLLQATNLLGPWTTNSTALSPYTVSPTNARSFFRVRTP